MEYGILCCNTEDGIQFIKKQAVKMVTPKSFWYMSMKQESPKNVKKVHILAFNYPIMLTIINVKELIQDSILFQKLSKVVQIFFSIIRTRILMLELN